MIIKEDKQIIEELLAYLKLSRNALGLAIGEKNGTKFNHIISGRNGISEKLAKKITDTFPEINYNWLLLKSEHMLVEEENSQKENKSFISTANGNIDIDIIVDAILLNQEKFESNTRFQKYLKGVKNEGIIEFQKKMIQEYENMKK